MARNSTTDNQARFASVPEAQIPRSKLDRSCGTKTTLDAGYLVPIFVDEALPGDTLNMRMSAFARLATPLHPLMDNLFLDTFFFAVPVRLLWENWEAFNGAQKNPGDSTDFQTPTITPPVGGWPVGSLSDYFGLPTGVESLEVVSFWHRAYNLIYNEWFRDQNLIDSAVVDTDDGPDTDADYVLRRRAKRADYFTRSLPFAQKGPDVGIPLASSAPVVPSGGGVPSWNAGDANNSLLNAAQSSGLTALQPAPQTGNFPMGWNNPALEADLTNSTATTINALRQAFQLQKLYERDARGGTRYTETILSHFGVTSPDARLQRPEYLGGGTSAIMVTPVPQTSETGQTTPQGNLSAYGTSAFSGHGFNKSFTEHSVVIGMVNLRADLNYQQGIHRMFNRRDRFDFYWPALAHLGEQAVLNEEIYADGTAADKETFGFQERFGEYRYKPSMITGQFRSQYAQSLDVWHLAQDFGTRPALNQQFIEDDPPIDRVIAVPSEPHLLLDTFFQYRCARPMPVFGVPGLIDHF